MQIWKKIGRGFYLLMKPVLRLALTKKPRTRCVVINDGDVLLVQNWLGKQSWTLPGGGIRLKEPPQKSVKREVKEELDISLNEVTSLGSYECEEDGIRLKYLLFGARIKERSFTPRRGEIINAGWFRISTLPKAKSDVVQVALNRLREQ